MRKISNNKLRMYAAVRQVLENNKVLWETVTAIAAVIAKIFSMVDEIEEKRLIAEADNTGATEDKNDLGDDYIFQILLIAGALHSHGFSIKNSDLMAKTDLYESELKNMREVELVRIGNSILELAVLYAEVLVDYAILQDDITLLETLSIDFGNSIGSPRTTIAERKAANDSIAKLIKRCDETFKKQLDKLMLRYKRTNPDFYEAYVNTRLLVELGVRHENNDEESSGDE